MNSTYNNVYGDSGNQIWEDEHNFVILYYEFKSSVILTACTFLLPQQQTLALNFVLVVPIILLIYSTNNSVIRNAFSSNFSIPIMFGKSYFTFRTSYVLQRVFSLLEPCAKQGLIYFRTPSGSYVFRDTSSWSPNSTMSWLHLARTWNAFCLRNI